MNIQWLSVPSYCGYRSVMKATVQWAVYSYMFVSIWVRAAIVINYLFHSLHYFQFHNGEACVADRPLHFLCRGWMKDEGEWKHRTLQTGVSKHAQTHRQQRQRHTHTQAARPNSSPLYSAVHLAHLTSERNHFTKGSKVISSQSGGWCLCVCVCCNGRVCASSVPAHIIYQQRLQCVRTSVGLCQRGFPFASVAQSHTGRGQEGWLSTVGCRETAHERSHYKRATASQRIFHLHAWLSNKD